MRKGFLSVLVTVALVAVASAAFAAEATPEVISTISLATALGMALAAAGCGIGQGLGLKAACEGTARNPEASGKITVTMLIGLARACGVNPSQIRKDLAYFGEFGVRGVGYYVQDLLAAIKQSLGIDRTWNAALVGVGNLGRALLRHGVFRRRGFILVGAFDCDPFKIGEEIAGLEVVCSRRLKEQARELNIEIGIITTPPERAQRAANYLVEAGIRGIVNFASARIAVPDNISVEYVDFMHHFFSVAFNISLDQARNSI